MWTCSPSGLLRRWPVQSSSAGSLSPSAESQRTCKSGRTLAAVELASMIFLTSSEEIVRVAAGAPRAEREKEEMR
jgi:hypothetical protein